jgi:hypothetical protein
MGPGSASVRNWTACGQSGDRQGEEKHHDRCGCTEEGALPDREGCHRVELRADRECPVAVVRAQSPLREQRYPEPGSNTHRHRRHPKDERDLAPHSARLALPGEQGNDLLEYAWQGDGLSFSYVIVFQVVSG